jgi:hypothetical protein
VDERARKLALNEAFFRDVNERINEQAEVWGHGAPVAVEYLCECSNSNCTFKIELKPEEYEHVRSNGEWFAIVPDHELPEIEDVVERHDGYSIVSKRGDTGAFVALLDPRSRS